MCEYLGETVVYACGLLGQNYTAVMGCSTTETISVNTTLCVCEGNMCAFSNLEQVTSSIMPTTTEATTTIKCYSGALGQAVETECSAGITQCITSTTNLRKNDHACLM